MEMINETASKAEFEQYVKHFESVLRRSALAMCPDWHTADDLLQETLIILYLHWKQIQPAARNAYARVVMAHLLDHWHRGARWERESLYDVIPEVALVAQEGGDEITERLAIRDALGALSKRQRSAVILRYWHSLSIAEISYTLNVPRGTVQSDLFRAVARLRALLGSSLWPAPRLTRFRE